MQQARTPLDSLAAIERRARRAMDTLDRGGARNGRTALMEIANEAADARRHAADPPAPFGLDHEARAQLTLYPDLAPV